VYLFGKKGGSSDKERRRLGRGEKGANSTSVSREARGKQKERDRRTIINN